MIGHCIKEIQRKPPAPIRFGKVRSATGLVIEATGLEAAIGELCTIRPSGGAPLPAEVIGVRGSAALLMPLGESTGLRAGSLIERSPRPHTVPVGKALLGRVIDASGRPIDGKGPLVTSSSRPVRAEPPPPLDRQLIDEPLETGVRAIDGMLTMAKGQRVGIFAGSGVGKSTLLGTIAKNSTADVNVIALIGERGREVREFVIDTLGDSLERSVVIAVTGDQAALARVKGALVATAVAEHFRDEGLDVLLMMDSVTRVAQAQREIGLAAGEPPTTRGYTPSVFALLPRLLERAGPGPTGTIT
ncbi:FliI/YscN family ATPase, partial [Rubrivirga sp.]|uniref:FliI/YscN family ATPase n=1 Tax=Rubrivirga sp. TaxID=1885344 RepID=UPI003C763883